MADEQPVASTAELSFPDFLRHVLTTPTALLLMGAFICNNFVAVVLLSWMPNFLYTKFNLTLAAAGLSATIFAQLASMAGSPIGGWLADTLRKRTPAGRILVQAFAALAAAPFVYLCGTRPEYALVLSSLFLWGMFKGLYDANIWASLFDVIRPEARGRAVGFMNMVGWIGGGTAPLIIGLMAEKQGLGSAIATSGFVYVLGAALLALAAIAINRIPRASAV
jgi:sugar phosphate permease